ncbi:lytic murein transglycosylase [Loktanella sp. SALINAS62]|uniref:lytic murein transglycosylase n=1 Tax=Loktanella sp. SALINAS62 TaxID=2706124 RepID=UPI001B8CB9C5|nr:lytic murein transglycosylase [Loktanella sp. SALINAS62]MBS1302559.1 lytic murein transglycosylase [Loktanella sp. SALINAS62]
MLRVLTLIFLMCASVAQAQSRDQAERQFQNWQQATLWPLASRAGVARPVFDAALAGITLDWDLPDLVPPGTSAAPHGISRQAEFGAPARYFASNTIDGAVSGGRQMAQRHAAALAATARATGVPAHIILAIWGRESAYGRAAIPHNAVRVLGTKAFMSSRADYFTAELIAALQIMQAGHIAPGAMKSSWAGALGQPQFMPSSFLRYAADGDGDGRADIWGSEPDTIASIGTYLARHGWVPGRDWGFEVTVPATITCALEGPDQGRRIADWEAMGIARVGGRAFPAHERGQDGFLLMPAGRLGPAFIVTPNFYVLKDYNESDLYALFVGHVGDKIAYGVGPFTGRWGGIDTLTRGAVAAMQTSLQRMGMDTGGADGLAGFRTRRSIGAWQQATGQAPTCFPDRAIVRALGG